MKSNIPQSSVSPTLNPPRNRSAFTSERSARFNLERVDNELTALKERVAAHLEQEFSGTIGTQFIRQIVNEATALAATTGYPALLLPTLAEEKAQTASAWAARQRVIRDQTLTLAA